MESEFSIVWPPAELRLLLVTDNSWPRRFRHAFGLSGLDVLATNDSKVDVFLETIGRLKPDLIVVSIRKSSFQLPAVLAYIDSRPEVILLIHVAKGLWRKGSAPQLNARLHLSERECLADVVTLIRFIQATRYHGVPSIDFADFGAWLWMAASDSTVAFMSIRVPSGGAKLSDSIPIMERLRQLARSARCIVAYSMEVPSNENALDALKRIDDAMSHLGLALAFGTVFARGRPPAGGSRLIIGMLQRGDAERTECGNVTEESTAKYKKLRERIYL